MSAAQVNVGRRGWHGLIALCVLSLVALAADRGSAAQQPPPAAASGSTLKGVYTAEQATRGQATFGTACTGCHTTSAYAAPAFVRRWDGRPLSELYELIADTMPEDAPGALTPKEYAQVIAYLLRINRMPAGRDELPADPDVLRTIRFETTTR
ncbi:MAG TPA: cytochrome c [Vicinamibacterales bacterium]|nr:cytochrome c [Vicinamibacterales bacterium]